jgi:MinD-like ATPase involved in chromosome partitioning or flagellar assembly
MPDDFVIAIASGKGGTGYDWKTKKSSCFRTIGKGFSA